jgi:enoyl-CoA hydratase/carnithine racemase
MQSEPFPNDPVLLADGPISAAMIRAGLEAQPDAAMVLLDLLRSINLEHPERALVQESMSYGLLQGSAAHVHWRTSRAAADGPNEPGNVRIARTGNIIDITLDRPAAHNAIDRSMRDSLSEAFTVAALDSDVTRVRFRGVGKAFCIGADLAEFGTTRDPATAHRIRMATLPAHAIVRCGDKFEAHVQGACVGAGLEMVAFAKRITATPNAWFQLPELAMGLIPGAGGCVSVSSRIGRRRATALILSGRRIGARTALDWGLIDAIMDDAPVDDRHSDVDG